MQVRRGSRNQDIRNLSPEQLGDGEVRHCSTWEFPGRPTLNSDCVHPVELALKRRREGNASGKSLWRVIWNEIRGG